MRAWCWHASVQIVLWWGSLGLLHGLRRIAAYYYHHALAGMALPLPTRAVGLPLLGSGFYCPQPHTVLFYLFWGALFLTPPALALWASRGGDEAQRHRRWGSAMTTYCLTCLLSLLAWAWTLALPFLPIGAQVP